MTVHYEERESDSPFLESVWHTVTQSNGSDIVAADTSWDMIIARQDGKVSLHVWGPMTQANLIPHSEGSEHLGLRFKLGTFMPRLPANSLLNTGSLLPEASSRAFWLDGSAWEYPTFENVESFVERLVRGGSLGQDNVVQAALQGHAPDYSSRSVQRRFVQVTGLTHRSIRAIERAQQAAQLLRKGSSILDAVFEAEFSDQQHMTKSMKQFLGQTPAQIAGIR